MSDEDKKNNLAAALWALNEQKTLVSHLDARKWRHKSALDALVRSLSYASTEVSVANESVRIGSESFDAELFDPAQVGKQEPNSRRLKHS